MSQERTWFGVRVVIECRIAGEPDVSFHPGHAIFAPAYEPAAYSA